MVSQGHPRVNWVHSQVLSIDRLPSWMADSWLLGPIKVLVTIVRGELGPHLPADVVHPVVFTYKAIKLDRY